MDQSLDPHAGSQHVFNRKYELCDYLKQNFPTPDQLITSCRDCTTFLCVCCQHWNHERPLPCHNFRLIFTDGACLSNGTAAATSGAGIAMGQADRLQFSYPIDDSIDSTGKRTSQRAELLAAILGLGAAQSVEELADAHERLYNRHKAGEDAGLYSHWIITTDSKYLVDGMTDWLPNKWKVSLATEYASGRALIRTLVSCSAMGCVHPTAALLPTSISFCASMRRLQPSNKRTTSELGSGMWPANSTPSPTASRRTLLNAPFLTQPCKRHAR